MASQTSLEVAAQQRKERLAKLKSLKRKEPDSAQDDLNGESASPTPQSASTFVSGRNYDLETRGPKLGFETAPDANVETLEAKAEALAAEVKKKAEEDAKDDKELDLFKLQPKKPNWDLKRDVDKRMERLNTRTNNAISRLVRDRIEQQQKAKQNGSEAVDGEAVGMEGGELVEAMHVREKEEEEEARREREIEEEEQEEEEEGD
ncbi:hypothetical protein EV356DRAFT_472079 [Viridothelium virens]|uniref:Cwf18 pre-mRNA splicing factor n=1 Tax=Viridothelium virens TaxID=1048519 RepID=A0A6A6GZN5_VIRVR|nr:hypothetical protein EV356DRAFT_472079 [Viridothelium virens]